MILQQRKKADSMYKRVLEWLYLRTKNNLVYFDALTGAYNRQFYKRELIKKTINEEYVIVLLDLNNLKITNDTLGHSAGDKLLIDIVSSLKKFGRVCRMGGDEFLLITDFEGLKKFKKYAYNNNDFCYAYMVKEKGVCVDMALEAVDKELVEIKENYRKCNPRGTFQAEDKPAIENNKSIFKQ